MVPVTVTGAGPVVYVRRVRPTDGVYDSFVVATNDTGSAYAMVRWCTGKYHYEQNRYYRWCG
jgi:hypothetical protein